MKLFPALYVEKTEGSFSMRVRELALGELPPLATGNGPTAELLVEVGYSSVNYKDALACSPDGKVVRQYPIVPGIDLAGTVVESESPAFRPGDKVLATGYELGVARSGGYAKYARVPADWAVRLPEGLSAREAMVYGTAGFTAALSVLALQDGGVRPDSGPVLVTGASGGVGSLAVAMLAKLGYEAVASSGKEDMRGTLMGLGASKVISREELMTDPAKPLGRQLWAGAVDCVGGPQLASVLGTVRYGGTVAASGLTGGTLLPATVLPFILRGIRLIGIDSVYAPMEIRQRIWPLLAGAWKPSGLAAMAEDIALDEIPAAVQRMLQGESRGRLVVKL
ncbi:oxidoreductase [Paenibacillus gansuensis]|uniref:Oxidoreductase n=1 Tax=Paenibacillus gansuensis TaxID=306542 RepID=A0ABW5PEV9_9BACL